MARPAILFFSLYLVLSPILSWASLLREVAVALARYEKWDPETEVRVPHIDEAGAKVSSFCGYQFLARVGKSPSSMTAKATFVDGDVAWRKTATPAVKVEEESYDVVAGDAVMELASVAVPDLEIVGPSVVSVLRRDHNGRIELVLPSSNTSYAGLRKIRVADGITFKIKGAQEVTLSHPYDIGMKVDGSLETQVRSPDPFQALAESSCSPVLIVQTVGSVTVVAQGIHDLPVKSLFGSNGEIELSVSYNMFNGRGRPMSTCLFCTLSQGLMRMERSLQNLVENTSLDGKPVRFLRAKVRSTTFVRFRLQMERDVDIHDTMWDELADWKMKPRVQHFWLEVVVLASNDGTLKVLEITKLRKPHAGAEATSWSSFMSNMSFTSLSSFIVPPEVLTLDVRW